MLEHLVLLYLIIINAAELLLMLADKLKAKRGVWRISEATLMGIAAVGGSIGALAGMYLFRHKTRHIKFTLGIPALLLVQITLAVWLLTWRNPDTVRVLCFYRGVISIKVVSRIFRHMMTSSTMVPAQEK